MDERTKDIIASNLVTAFYSAVERRAVDLGEEQGKTEIGTVGVDMRLHPSISPEEVFEVYKTFLKMINEEDNY
jgi:hypothetical protein